MKKWAIRILEWPHTAQVVDVLCALPWIILWCRGKATTWQTCIVGWNLGLAVAWQFYIEQRKRTTMWMNRALTAVSESPKFEELLGVAKNLVEARLQSAKIDPDRN